MSAAMTCVCAHKLRRPKAGEPYDVGLCRACWLHLNPGQGGQPMRPPCVELGDPLTKVELARIGLDMATCGCAGKIRWCNFYEALCTISARRHGVDHCCLTCNEYEPKSV